MYYVANEFDMQLYSSLRFLKLLYNENEITVQQVKNIVSKWHQIDDLPKNFHKEYKLFFGDMPFSE